MPPATLFFLPGVNFCARNWRFKLEPLYVNLTLSDNNRKDFKVKNAGARFHKLLKGTVNTEIISHEYLVPQSPMANGGTKTPAEEKQVTVQKPSWLRKL